MIFSVPCGRCVGRGDVCNRDSCVLGLTCAKLKDLTVARVCHPTIAPGQWCNDSKSYDPCESGFVCDRSTGNCQVVTTFSSINDGCLNNDYCNTGLDCLNKVCALPSGADCSSPAHCIWNQYCDVGGTSAACRILPSPGETCGTLGGACKFGSACTTSTTSASRCIEYFTIPQDGTCTATVFCKPGHICHDKICIKPNYHYLSGPGVKWGPECNPADNEPGCRCNYAAKAYMYLLEASVVFAEGCPTSIKELDSCMSQNSCSNINTGYESCMRRKCMPQYRNFEAACGNDFPLSGNNDASLRSPVCGAAEMFVAIILVVFVVLL